MILPNKSTLAIALAFVLMLFTTWISYQPAIQGPFLLDDFDNLGALSYGVNNQASLHNYLATGNAGPLGRPLAKLSFLLDDQAWPSDPAPFKRTNLLIHLLCAVLLFVALRQLLRMAGHPTSADAIALFITALWALHPFNVSTVMYVVQRMAQLSAMFILAGIGLHLWLRSRDFASEWARVILLSISLVACGLCSALSKESGVLMLMYLLAIEGILLKDYRRSPPVRIWRWLAIYLPALMLAAYILYVPQWANGYANRDFTLTERVLTECIVLWDYLSHIFSLSISGLGLIQDDYPVARELWQPRTLLAVFAWSGTALAAVLLRQRLPWFSFAIVWYLGGHLLESSTVALELYFEHRNYLPMIGPLAAASIAAHAILRRLLATTPKLLPLLGILLLGLPTLKTNFLAREWSDAQRLTAIWYVEHQESMRAHRVLAHMQASAGQDAAALTTLDDAYARFPDDLSLPLMSLDIACVFGRPLRYEATELARQVATHRWTDGLRPAFASLYGHMDKPECASLATGLHHLVDQLPTWPQTANSRRAIASIQILDGDYALRSRNYTRALQAFSQVDQDFPTKDSALRLSNFFLHARSLEDALKWLDIAKERAELSRRPLQQNERLLFSEKRLQLVALLKQQKDAIAAPATVAPLP
jgi:hypothetical protein